MKRLSAAVLLAAGSAWAQLPQTVTLDDVLRIVEKSPRVAVSERETDIARAERAQAGAFANPTLSLGRSTASSGERTIFGADSQQQATVELPVPIFGQRGARVRAADLQVGRAESALRLTVVETKRLAALEFVRLAAAQEQLNARRTALADVERIRGIVAGRQSSGMASRYDLARADAERALASLGVQKALHELNGHSSALAALVDAPGWRPQPAMGVDQVVAQLGDAESDIAGNAALRVARDETAAAEARVELARRERYPVPALQLGRTWTTGPYGAANFVGVASEIPILDTRRALEDKAIAEHGAARERQRIVSSTVQAEFQKQREALALRREALARFDHDVFDRQSAFLEMAESAYRLGRGTLFELLDARRTRLEAALARAELVAAIAETQLELRALSGSL
ncbi:MAG TPA: TolC family protein [Burkholderiales bacterium]|nr:TolC family protein [Burkholderiales bacterium]